MSAKPIDANIASEPPRTYTSVELFISVAIEVTVSIQLNLLLLVWLTAFAAIAMIWYRKDGIMTMFASIMMAGYGLRGSCRLDSLLML